MLEYLSLPSLVNVQVNKPRWRRVLQQDLDSRAEQLTALVKQHEEQQEEEGFQISVFSRSDEDQWNPWEMRERKALYRSGQVSRKKARIARRKVKDLMGPELWEQQYLSQTKEMQDFVQQYGQHPSPYNPGFDTSPAWFFYRDRYPNDPPLTPLSRYFALLDDRHSQKEEQLYYKWEGKIRETLEELACIKRCFNRLHYGPTGLPRSVFAR
jgi:hypothetical protein